MTDAPVTDPTAYVPPKVWTWNKESGGRFASINRPVAGPTHDKELPVGGQIGIEVVADGEGYALLGDCRRGREACNGRQQRP